MNDKQMKIKANIASPWRRLLAYVIDVLIGIAFFELLLFMIASPVELNTLLNNLFYSLILLIFFLAVLVPLITTLLISQFGGTPGKLLTGINIIDERGSYLGFQRAFFRNHIGYLVSKLFLWIGFIWILVDKQRRGWHDLITSSWVVVRNKSAIFIGIAALLILLGFDIFLGRMVCTKFNQNRGFYQEMAADVANEIKNNIKEESSLPEVPSELEEIENLNSVN